MRWIGLGIMALATVTRPPVVWDASPNYTASNREVTYDIHSVVIHTTEGIDTNGDGYFAESYTQAINTFNSSSSQVSAHYVIAPWGEITQMVADDDIAWHATYYNSNSIGIECAGFSASPNTWTPQLLSALADLVAWLVRQYDIPAVHPTDDANDWNGWYGGRGILGHYQIQTPGSAAAATYGTRTDPGPYFPWTSFVNSVRSRLSPPAATNLRATAQADGATVDFAWDGQAGVTYTVDIAQSQTDLSSMTGTFQNRIVGSATATTWAGLAPGTTYYWRVWASNSYGGNHGYPAGPVVTPSAAGSSGESTGTSSKRKKRRCGAGAEGEVASIALAAAAALLILAHRR